MASRATFCAATGIGVFLTDPRSPWQRGSNRTPPHAGGAPADDLLWRYFSQGTDLSGHGDAHPDTVAAERDG